MIQDTGEGFSTVVIVLDPVKLDLNEILKNCYKPRLNANPNAGNSNSAIKYCTSKAEKGLITFCLSASNGIQSLLLFGTEEKIKELYEYASVNCKELDFWQKRHENILKYL